jgi:integrase
MLGNEILPTLGHLRVTAVTHEDIDGLHRRISTLAPSSANRTVTLLVRLFNLAIKWLWLAINPARSIERNTEEPRTRHLSSDELSRLIDALNSYRDAQAANIIRLLLLTGARCGEVLKHEVGPGRFGHGSLGQTKHFDQAKARAPHAPEPSCAHTLATNSRSGKDIIPICFPIRANRTPRVNIKGPWRKICNAARIENLRTHDARHSFASWLVSSGQSFPTIGRMLGHSQPQTTARYSHLADAPLRQAAEIVGEIVSKHRPKI